jgi:hypothetical protein
MFLARKIMRVAVVATPRRFFAIDAVQHPVSALREPSARVLKLAEVRYCTVFVYPPNVLLLSL